jgi:hypothetical protein
MCGNSWLRNVCERFYHVHFGLGISGATEISHNYYKKKCMN